VLQCYIIDILVLYFTNRHTIGNPLTANHSPFAAHSLSRALNLNDLKGIVICPVYLAASECLWLIYIYWFIVIIIINHSFIHTIQYSTIQYNTIQYKTIHTIPYHTISYHTIPYHYIPIHTITYQYIPVHTITYHYISLHTITYHYIPLHYSTLHYITIHLHI